MKSAFLKATLTVTHAVPTYLERVVSTLRGGALQRPRARRLSSQLASLALGASSVLDVGCGDGRIGASVAAAIGASVRGVDVVVQPRTLIDVERYDGVTLPAEANAYDVVLLSDVLHHATDGDALLTEALRVARHAVVLKDHFAYGPGSRAMLLSLDLVGNLGSGVALPAAYATPAEWLERFGRVGARVARLLWPLDVHGSLVRLVTRSELQFAARLVRSSS